MAKKSGNIVMNGKLMFIYQALAAFRIWHKINLKINDETIDLLNS
jgi:shikimate dehydrogenase